MSPALSRVARAGGLVVAVVRRLSRLLDLRGLRARYGRSFSSFLRRSRIWSSRLIASGESKAVYLLPLKTRARCKAWTSASAVGVEAR